MATAITDQAAAQAAVDALTQAIALLKQVRDTMSDLSIEGTGIHGTAQIVHFADSAAETADLALMVAANELKLAQRDQT